MRCMKTPVLLCCKQLSLTGSHDNIYERRSILEYLDGKGNGECLICRQSLVELLPAPAKLTEIMDSIAADVVWTDEKLKAFNQARERLAIM